MLKINVPDLLYKNSPMNFYTKENGNTVIKSINNPSVGYLFTREFTPEETDKIWDEIKRHRKIATVIIFVLFILLLYEIIFPKFIFFTDNGPLLNSLIMIFLAVSVSQVISLTFAVMFEKKLKKLYGDFEKVKFNKHGCRDEKYYGIFLIELKKSLITLTVILICASLISPFELTKKLLRGEHYKQAIKITDIGSKIFPIASEWYSLRGYAKYKIGDYKGAIEDYDRAYNLDTDELNLTNFDNKIYIKYSLGDYGGAIIDFDKEIREADTTNKQNQILWDKAQFLYNIKKFDEALDLYNDLLIKAETDRIFLLKDRLYLERAIVHKAKGNLEQAAKDLEASGTDNYDEQPRIPAPVLIIEDENI